MQDGNNGCKPGQDSQEEEEEISEAMKQLIPQLTWMFEILSQSCSSNLFPIKSLSGSWLKQKVQRKNHIKSLIKQTLALSSWPCFVLFLPPVTDFHKNQTLAASKHWTMSQSLCAKQWFLLKNNPLQDDAGLAREIINAISKFIAPDVLMSKSRGLPSSLLPCC